jgi:argininosuccinate lyase
VRRGVPFRESHEIVGKAIREAEERATGLEELSSDVFRALHPAFDSDVLEVFSWERSVEARGVPGGTARGAVLAQMERARAAAEG